MKLIRMQVIKMSMVAMAVFWFNGLFKYTKKAVFAQGNNGTGRGGRKFLRGKGIGGQGFFEIWGCQAVRDDISFGGYNGCGLCRG